MSPFIDDGYTEKQKVSGFEIEFRPLTKAEVSRWLDSTDNKNFEDTNKITAGIMAAHIISWDLEPEPDEAAILKLRSSVFDRIMAMLWSTTDSEKN